MVDNKTTLQKKIFDQRPAQVAWSSLLVEKGFFWLARPREKKHLELIKKLGLKPGDKVLDVGCGSGHFLTRLEKHLGIKGVGIDISPKSIKLAKRWQKENLEFRVSKAEKLPFEDESFDYVFCFDVLEHIKEQRQALREMARVLKKDGWLLLYTMNKKRRFTWNWFLEKLGVPVFRLAAHDKRLFLLPEELEAQLKNLGARKELVVYYDSFFCLILNEMMTLFGNLMIKLRLERSRFLGRIFLCFTTGVSRILGPFFDFFDWPWKKLGLSNSFYLLLRKEE